MAYFGQVKMPDRLEPYLIGSSLYGTTNTYASSPNKFVSTGILGRDFDELVLGVTVNVQFIQGNTVENITLKVGSTAALPVHGNAKCNQNALLSFTYGNVDGVGHWILNAGEKTATTVMQHYDSSSTEPISGAGVAEAIAPLTGGTSAATLGVDTTIGANPTNDKVPTSAAVAGYVTDAFGRVDAVVYKGTIGVGGDETNVPVNGYSAGWLYKILSTGTYAGERCEEGDLVLAIQDAGQFQTTANNAHWTIIQKHIVNIVSGPTHADTGNVAIFDGNSTTLADSGHTINADVPANAVFTDTTYSEGVGIEINEQNQISVTFGETAGTVMEGNDPRINGPRPPTAHTHGNITDDGKLTEASQAIVTNAQREIVNKDLSYDSDDYIIPANATSIQFIDTLQQAADGAIGVTRKTIPIISTSEAGLVPQGEAISANIQQTKFLRSDGNWAIPEYSQTVDEKVKQSPITLSTIDVNPGEDLNILLKNSENNNEETAGVKFVNTTNANVTINTKTGKVSAPVFEGTNNTPNTIHFIGKASSASSADTAVAVPLTNITNADDLKAIESLNGTNGLLKKVNDGQWTLDTTVYATAADLNNVMGVADALTFQGTIGTAANGGMYQNIPTSNYLIGYTYRIVTAGTYAGQICEVGDLVIAIENATENQSVIMPGHWIAVQGNIEGVVSGPTDSVDDHIVLFSGTTGHVLKDSGTTIANAHVALADSATVATNVHIDATATQGRYYIPYVGISGTGNFGLEDSSFLSYQYGEESSSLIIGGIRSAGRLTLVNGNGNSIDIAIPEYQASRTYTLPLSTQATDTIALVSSNITGTAANVTGTVSIANGGTGATTAAAAWTALGGNTAGQQQIEYFVAAVDSTDEAVVRFNGANGQVQDSLVTIDDYGNVYTDGKRIPNLETNNDSLGDTTTPVYIDNGEIKSCLSYSSANVNYASNADTVDNIHAEGFLRNFYYNTELDDTDSFSNDHYLFTIGGSTSWTGGTLPDTADAAFGILHMHLKSGNYYYQLGFNAKNNELHYRSVYNSNTWGDWRTVLSSSNYTDYTVTQTGGHASGTWNINVTGSSGSCTGLSAKATADANNDTIHTTYLKLSGGTMTGAIHLVGHETAAWNTSGLIFTDGSRIGEDDQGGLGIYAGGILYLYPASSAAAATEGIQISTGGLYPSVTTTMTLGLTNKRWSNVYSTTFTGDLTGDVTGNATSSSSILDSDDDTPITISYNENAVTSFDDAAVWNGYHITHITKANLMSQIRGIASGSWGIDITGNADTATNATNDASGNTITTYYCTLTTAQTISGNKTLTGNINIGTNGAGGIIYGNATASGCNTMLIGDDVQIGAVNVDGILGMRSAGSICGFYLYDDTGTQIGQFYADGSGFFMDSKLYINNNETAGLNTNGALVIGAKNSFNLGFDDIGIQARQGSAASTLYLNYGGGAVSTGGALVVTGAITSGGDIWANTGYLKSTLNGNTVTIGSANAQGCYFSNSQNIPFYFDNIVGADTGFSITNAGNNHWREGALQVANSIGGDVYIELDRHNYGNWRFLNHSNNLSLQCDYIVGQNNTDEKTTYYNTHTVDYDTGHLTIERTGAYIYFANSTGTTRGIQWTFVDNDLGRIVGGVTNNAGFMEWGISSSAAEPIYIRQYGLNFGTITNTFKVLDENGYTTIPNRLYFDATSDGIWFHGTQTTSQLIHFIDNTLTLDGNGIKIGGSGLVMLGAGGATDVSITGDTKNLYLLSENVVYIESSADPTDTQSLAGRTGVSVDIHGNLIPVLAESGNDNVQNIGSDSYRWANIYVNATNLSSSLIFDELANSGDSNGIYWSDASHSASIYYTLTSAVTSSLVLNTSDSSSLIALSSDDTEVAYFDNSTPSFYPATDNTGSLGISDTRWGAVFVGTSDAYGNEGQPIYWNDGVPAEIDWHIGNSNVGEHNANNVTYNFNGYYTSNGPSGLGNQDNAGALYAQAATSTQVGQIAQDYASGNLFVRGKNGNNWADWKAIPCGLPYVMTDKKVSYDASAQKFTKVGSSTSWDAQACSTIGYKECRIIFRPGQVNAAIVCGLNEDPVSSVSNTSIRYAWDLGNGGSLLVREGSTTYSITGHATYAAGDELIVEYSNGTVRYYHNGRLCYTTMREYTLSPALPLLYFDSSFNTPSGYLYDVYFEPIHTGDSLAYTIFTIRSGMYGVQLTSDAFLEHTYVAQIVVTTGETNLTSKISWSSAEGYVQLTTDTATDGDVSGYILTGRGYEITATASDIIGESSGGNES